jgi:repressor LexA
MLHEKAGKMGRTPPGQTRERVFRLVRDRLLAGRPPTVREVQQAFGFRSVQTAREHLEALVSEGRLAKERGKSRGYRLPLGSAPPTRLVPLLGRVQAGGLDAAVEEPEGYLPVQSRHAPGELFGLRVRGESMTGAGIFPGDIVVVRRQPTASSGEIVVALVGDEATVKRLRLRGRRVELHPENPDFEPILPDPDELMLLGKVVEVRRLLGAS